MKRNTKYVGLDVHQAMTVATVRSQGGRVIETGDESITEFFSAMRGSVHVVFEERTQAQWLYDLLSPRVDRVVVCDRRGEKRSGNKGDQVDADELSERLRCGGLRAVYHGAHGRSDLKELTRAYRNLVEDGTRVMLRLKALFRARAIRTTGGGVYQPKQRGAWLAQLPEGGARLRAETLYAQLDVLRAQRKKTKAAMVAEAKRDPAFGCARDDPLLWARAYRTVASNHGYAVALPHEAQPVGLCRTRRGHALELRLRVVRWASSPAAAPSAHSRVEPQPQSSPQECLQGRRQRSHWTSGPIPGLL